MIVHTIGWTLIHTLSTIVNGGLDRQIGFATMPMCGNGATPNRKGHMDIETFKTQVQPTLDYLSEQDSFEFEIAQTNNGGIRLYIKDSARFDDRCFIDIDYDMGVVDVNLMIPKQSAQWMCSDQLSKYQYFIGDLLYLLRKVKRIVGAK